MTDTKQATPPTSTPWGRSDRVTRIADGVYFVSTPSHGGAWIAPEHRHLLADIAGNWLGSDIWWEEDCDTLRAFTVLAETMPEVAASIRAQAR